MTDHIQDKTALAYFTLTGIEKIAFLKSPDIIFKIFWG